jgi:hypothetical protein
MPPPFQISPYAFGELDLLSVTRIRCHIMLQFAKHANQPNLCENGGFTGRLMLDTDVVVDQPSQ